MSEPLIHENPVPFCSFHTLSNNYVLTIAQNGIVRIWDYKRGSVILGPPVLSKKDLNTTSEYEGVKPSMYGIAVQPIAPPSQNIGKSAPAKSRVKALSVSVQ